MAARFASSPSESFPFIHFSLVHLSVDNLSVRDPVHRKDPSKIAWADAGVEYVAECTGIFKEVKGADKHITGPKGAKKVVVSAPSNTAPMFVMGVNHVRLLAPVTRCRNEACFLCAG